jgi:lysylphosphatidylglycerol synthetase-like protein (DUF2156 family)
VIWDLRELADVMGRRCAFYSVSEKYLPTYLDLGLPARSAQPRNVTLWTA